MYNRDVCVHVCPQVKDILAKTSSTRQTLLFSATLPRSLADFASAGLNAPKLVRLDQERRISPDLHQAFFTVRPEDRMAALMHIVKETVPVDQLTIVFVSTRHHAEYIYNLMIREGLPAACVFGSMDQVSTGDNHTHIHTGIHAHIHAHMHAHTGGQAHQARQRGKAVY